MIDRFVFESAVPGPTTVFLGAVHGNEVCGEVALRNTVSDFQNSTRFINNGKVIIAPVCNPEAFAQKKRYIDRNLNRSLYPKAIKTAYEDHLDEEICALLEQADTVVDLHSFSTKGKAFSMPSLMDTREMSLVRAIGISNLVTGWSEAYLNAGIAVDPLLSQGTTEYARLHGAVAITVECGQHDDPDSISVAQGVIDSVLAVHNGGALPNVPFTAHEMKNVWFRDDRPAEFVRPWQNFDRIARGEPIARYDDGEVLLAPYDAAFVMPKSWAVPGEEWFYLALPKILPAL